MNHGFLNFLALAGLTTMIPTVAAAQYPGCAAPVNCTISQTHPVVTTALRPQQVTTYRDVVETTVQRQQVVESVPVTTAKNVTVDEGGFQVVWVPKPVTRQVAQTTLQQQIKTVNVPIQVTRRVPQLTTQMVPVQSVQYVTHQVPVQMVAIAQPTCDACVNRRVFGAAFMPPRLGYLPPIYQPAPYVTAAIPVYPTTDVATPQTGSTQTLTFLPNHVMPNPTPIAPTPEAYETVPAREVPIPKDEATAPVRKTSMFSGVPSAVTVWQSKNTSVR